MEEVPSFSKRAFGRRCLLVHWEGRMGKSSSCREQGWEAADSVHLGHAEGKPHWRGQMAVEGLASQVELSDYIRPVRGSHYGL